MSCSSTPFTVFAPFARTMLRTVLLASSLAMGLATGLATAAEPPAVLQLRIVGGIGSVPQFKQFEDPFWRDQFPVLTQGRARATVVAFDRAGIRSHEVMRLMELGVVPFGTTLINNILAVDPELAAMDLAGINPDMAALKRSVSAFRPHFEAAMRERHRIQVLAIYVYPAQVVFCAQPFAGLSDLKGRRVRISNASQGDLIRPFGAQPVSTEFSEVVSQVHSGNVDCAITGSMSGNAIGLHEVTSHISPVAVNWGLSVFGANVSAWESLPADVRATLQTALPRLESDIWADAERQHQQGLLCNTGQAGCVDGKPGRMQWVKPSAQDQVQLQQSVRTSVLPAWLQRCGEGCGAVWSRLLAPVTGVQLPNATKESRR